MKALYVYIYISTRIINRLQNEDEKAYIAELGEIQAGII